MRYLKKFRVFILILLFTGIVTGLAARSVAFNTQSDGLKNIWVATLQLMTSTLSTIMMQQVQIIGSFFDAKHQLETQRLLQEKYAQVHKDYQPSEQLCEIGTFTRNLAESNKRLELTKMTMSRSMMDRALMQGDVSTKQTGVDEDTKIKNYQKKFCNPADNMGANENLCGKGAEKQEQKNADINFTQTIDMPLTISMNMMDSETTPQEENVLAFLDYIFMAKSFPWKSNVHFMVNNTETVNEFFSQTYQEMRSLIAMRSVAKNSFAHIIGEKTESTKEQAETIAPFLRAMMKEMGLKPEDIDKTIGKNPSYYAQMEILTKKIYQSPEFIANLYDKPANVKRIKAALTAIKMMQDRDIHDALQRREMLMSILLEIQLRGEQQEFVSKEVMKVLASNQLGATSPDAVSSDEAAEGASAGEEGF